jgi:tight adherence protein C
LADEMSLTAIELEMIPDSRQVFTNLENRTDSLQIKTLSKTLSQSIEYGSSLSVSLRDLAVESRQKRMLDAEAAAAQAPTLLTLPMMFFIMPCLFIVMLGPVIVGMIRSFSGGVGS